MGEQLRRIESVSPRPDYRLAIGWDSGASTTVSLADVVRRGGVFEPLQDKEKFAAARIGDNGRVIEWPEPRDDLGYPVVEIDADALYARSVNQGFRSAVSRIVEFFQSVVDGEPRPT